MNLKNSIRQLLIFLRLDLTKNLAYDRLTKVLISRVLRPDSNAVDVGCHKGEILDLFLKYAPEGHHVAFEPIPDFYRDLKQRYAAEKVDIYNYALADEAGTARFQYVKNAPAYSGLKKRAYKVKHPDNQEIEVPLRRLDAVVPEGMRIDLIKIDVEGAELGVLRGAKRLLRSERPVVVFECGLGASDFYGTRPEEVMAVFAEARLAVFTLKRFLKGGPPLTEAGFVQMYDSNREYYFVAAPRDLTAEASEP